MIRETNCETIAWSLKKNVVGLLIFKHFVLNFFNWTNSKQIQIHFYLHPKHLCSWKRLQIINLITWKSLHWIVNFVTRNVFLTLIERMSFRWNNNFNTYFFSKLSIFNLNHLNHGDLAIFIIFLLLSKTKWNFYLYFKCLVWWNQLWWTIIITRNAWC